MQSLSEKKVLMNVLTRSQWEKKDQWGGEKGGEGSAQAPAVAVTVLFPKLLQFPLLPLSCP